MAKMDAMERLDAAVTEFATSWCLASGGTAADHKAAWRGYIRARRALLRERAEAAEWAYISQIGDMGGTSTISQAIRAAVLGRPARRKP